MLLGFSPRLLIPRFFTVDTLLAETVIEFGYRVQLFVKVVELGSQYIV